MATRYDVMRAAFEDELSKIAGELQGYTRSGRRPISVERMLEREGEEGSTPSSVFGEKTSSVPKELLEKIPLKTLGAMTAGAGAYHVGTKANQDRRMGRAMRLQQNAMN
jgi:hypothetical protein